MNRYLVVATVAVAIVFVSILLIIITGYCMFISGKFTKVLAKILNIVVCVFSVVSLFSLLLWAMDFAHGGIINLAETLNSFY